MCNNLKWYIVLELLQPTQNKLTIILRTLPRENLPLLILLLLQIEVRKVQCQQNNKDNQSLVIRQPWRNQSNSKSSNPQKSRKTYMLTTSLIVRSKARTLIIRNSNPVWSISPTKTFLRIYTVILGVDPPSIMIHQRMWPTPAITCLIAMTYTKYCNMNTNLQNLKYSLLPKLSNQAMLAPSKSRI